jgi:tetratricopeptide (TPR) repeat protein
MPANDGESKVPEPSFWDVVERMLSSGKTADAISLLTDEFSGATRTGAARIAITLGQLYQERNSPDEAIFWYRKAIDSKDPEVAGEAAFALGNLLEEADAVADAESAYTEAMRFRGNGPTAAGLALANILMSHNREDAARAALRFAATSDFWAIATIALYQLALIVKESGNVWGAKLLLERAREDLAAAATDSDPEVAAMGQLRLGDVLSELGEVKEATERYRSAYESQVARVWPEAAASLAVLVSATNTAEAAEILHVLADHAEDDWATWVKDQVQSLNET